MKHQFCPIIFLKVYFFRFQKTNGLSWNKLLKSTFTTIQIKIKAFCSWRMPGQFGIKKPRLQAYSRKKEENNYSFLKVFHNGSVILSWQVLRNKSVLLNVFKAIAGKLGIFVNLFLTWSAWSSVKSRPPTIRVLTAWALLGRHLCGIASHLLSVSYCFLLIGNSHSKALYKINKSYSFIQDPIG